MWMGLGLASLLLRAGHVFLFSCAAGVTLFWTLQTLTLFFMGLWRELMLAGSLSSEAPCVNPASPSWAGRRDLRSSSSVPQACAPLVWVCPV